MIVKIIRYIFNNNINSARWEDGGTNWNRPSLFERHCRPSFVCEPLSVVTYRQGWASASLEVNALRFFSHKSCITKHAGRAFFSSAVSSRAIAIGILRRGRVGMNTSSRGTADDNSALLMTLNKARVNRDSTTRKRTGSHGSQCIVLYIIASRPSKYGFVGTVRRETSFTVHSSDAIIIIIWYA